MSANGIPAVSQELLKICESLLVFCHLVVKSIERTTDEAAGLREIATHLKSVFDEESTRERSYITALIRYNPILCDLDKRYYALKDAAKNLIKGVQEEKEKLDADYQEHLSEFQGLESQVYTARSISQQRDAELASLQEAIGNGSSVSSLIALRGEVASLGKQNRKLANEQRQLQTRLDEIAQEHGRGASVLSYVDSSRRSGTDSATYELEKSDARVEAMEAEVAELTLHLRRLKDSNSRVLAKERGTNHGLEEICHELLSRVENMRN